MQSYHVHIEPKTEGFSLNLREVWQYRDLIILLTKKAFTLKYKQTMLGPAWILLNPLLSSFAYLFIFGIIAGMSTDGVPQVLFYLTGTALWTLFSSTLTENAQTFIANSYMFGKVYFPRLTVSISYVLVNLIIFGIQMFMVAALLVFFTVQGFIAPRWELLIAIPFVLLQLCILAMSLGIILSSITTKYRDLQILVSFGMTLWMYATPVVYPASQLVGTPLHTAVMLNPVSSPIELLRYILLGTGTVEPLFVAISIAFTFVCALIGVVLFNHVEKTFIDTV